MAEQASQKSPAKAAAGQTAVAALLVTASTYISYALGLIVSALIARGIGPDNFGRYSYTVMVVGVLVIVANHGLTTSGIRFVSQCSGSGAQNAARNVHGWLQRGQLLSLLLVAILFVCSVTWLKPTGWAESTLIFIAIVTVCLFAKGMFLFDVSIAKGYRQFKVEALSNVAVSVASAVAVVLMYLTHASLLSYLILFAASSVAYWLFAAMMLRKLDIRPQTGPLEIDLMKSLRAHLGWTMVLTFVGAFSNKSIETFLLNMLTGPAEVGYFAIAVALTRGGVDLLSSGLTTVLMPMMAHAYGAGGNERVGRILPRTVRYFHFLGLLIAGMGVFLAKPVVILMYGNQYQPVIDILRIMMLVSGLTLSTGALGALLSITDHQRARAGFAIFTLAVNFAAAVALIPPLGLAGAVMAQAVSRVLTFFAMVYAAKKIMPIQWHTAELIRLTLAAALAGLLAAAIYSPMPELFADLAATAVFGLVYLGLSVWMNAWQREDVSLVISIVKRLPQKFQFMRASLERWEQKLPATGT